MLGLIVFGTWKFVDWAFEQDMKRAERICAEVNGTPSYIYRNNHGLCLAEDGTVVGGF